MDHAESAEAAEQELMRAKGALFLSPAFSATSA
jgi:hypothetical protein